jgi:hypothetical protein
MGNLFHLRELRNKVCVRSIALYLTERISIVSRENYSSIVIR